MGVGRRLLAILMTVIPFASYAASSSPRVQIETGTIEGKASGPVSSFLGIPYAAPTGGKLRWKPPAPAVKWTGVRSATEFGARCMQGPVYPDMVFRDVGGSEDCLSLNVWTPANGATAKLPVMVWIYGEDSWLGQLPSPAKMAVCSPSKV